MTTKKTTTKKTQTKKKDNLAFWNSVEKTDPSFTKHVDFGRGFTTIAAHYQIREATAKWGMLGDGWGVEVQPISDPNIVDSSLVGGMFTIWYKDEEGNKCYGVPIVATSPKHIGKRADDDAFKKATTDGITKGLSYFGFNADVFLGKFDDNKYVRELEKEFKEEKDKKDDVPFDRDEAIKAIKAHQDMIDAFDEDGGLWTSKILTHFDKDKITDLTDEQLQQVITRISKMEKKNNG